MVACGSGFDIVFADPTDVVRPSCERVHVGQPKPAEDAVKKSATKRPAEADRWSSLAAGAPGGAGPAPPGSRSGRGGRVLGRAGDEVADARATGPSS